MLRATLPLWLSYLGAPAVIRVRGRYAEAARDSCGHLSNVEWRVGADFRTWRVQALADVESLGQSWIFQYFEDHMPAPDAPTSASLMKFLDEYNPDVVPYSFFQSYRPLRDWLDQRLPGSHGAYGGTSLGRADVSGLRQQTDLMLVSLVSIFNSGFYRRILRSQRPFLRRFDPSAPFDVEQRADQNWFLPINFGLPFWEVGICIDDDHSVPGSSAAARGLVDFEYKDRELRHHKSDSLRSLWNLIAWNRRSRAVKVVSKVVTLLDALRYSVEAGLTHNGDKLLLFWRNMEKRLRGQTPPA